jgi:2-iminoacetate synthase
MIASRDTRSSGPVFLSSRDDEALLAAARAAGPAAAHDALARALEGRGLELAEVAALLACDAPDATAALFAAAGELKERVYGRRVVLFAPLYVSNHCRNECLYCAFRAGNRDLARRSLGPAEIADEVRLLLETGHKRLLLVAADEPGADPVRRVVEAVRAVYDVRHDGESVRRINVNVAPLGLDGFRELAQCGIGTYQLFQETYDRPTYRRLHPAGPKSDFDRQTGAPGLAMKAGIGDVGLGVLFGLHDPAREVLALVRHARALEADHGVGPHTISLPRVEPAAGSALSVAPPSPVDDETFLRLVAILRLALPYVGLILSTRETARIRREALALGVSQISAGSRTSPGGYSGGTTSTAQFQLGDHRSLDEVVADLLRLGYLPSFCTACYRTGRTGERFFSLATETSMEPLCTPNALLTLREYLDDHASAEARRLGLAAIEAGLDDLDGAVLRRATQKRLDRVAAGARDVFF